MHTNPDGTPKYTNRLIDATSPYLLQHAHNPVDWYPWGEAALGRAKIDDKPILLSVGYAACHWCHVLELESFEDESTADLMNTYFINIKVDREERPDIDSIYMTALQAMTGGGGWPMTIFMTPDGVPFYGGTYFPPEDRHQLPAFRRVLLSVAEAYKQRRADLLKAGDELVAHMRQATATRLPAGTLSTATLDEAYAVLHGMFEPDWGGFGGAPKFPQPMTLEFLLRYATRTGQRLAGEMLAKTLRAMAEGGIYDQLGGGFHRYSVDAQWLVPHFEKMLYDNALLAHCYSEAYQASGDAFYRQVAEETLDYLLREMRHPAGGFYSTQDADSLPAPAASHKHDFQYSQDESNTEQHTSRLPGSVAHSPQKEEGAFFVWSLAEVRAALGSDATAFAAVFDITERGNFEGSNILHIKRQPAEVARVMGIAPEKLATLMTHGKQTLFALRANRPTPDLDDKVLTAWNGMAIRAFARAARAFGRDDYRAAAQAAAEFVLQALRAADGTLLRSWRATSTDQGATGGTQPSPLAGRPSPTIGFLEDYALLADGLLALYEATFEPGWLLLARELADAMLARFWDDSISGFYDTSATHEQLVVRPRDTGDNATPSGHSVAADVLLRLAIIFDEPGYRERALTVIQSVAQFIERYPTGFGRYLSAAEFALAQPYEVVVVGDPLADDTAALLEVIFTGFLPHKVVVLHNPAAPAAFDSPLLEGRSQIDGRATAYVCQNYACQLPVTEPAALRAQLHPA